MFIVKKQIPIFFIFLLNFAFFLLRLEVKIQIAKYQKTEELKGVFVFGFKN